MRYLMPAAGVLLGLGALSIRRIFLVTTVSGTSMEPALRSGDRLLVRRTRRIRTGQVVVYRFDEPPGARRSRHFLIKRAAAVPGDRIPRDWEVPDVHRLAGTVVPSGSFALLGDNRLTSLDSRHHGLVGRDRLIGVVVRQLD